jgi:glycine/D-amino acid oxidase-like deaminating enzyme
MDRIVGAETVARARSLLSRRFPSLADRPVSETRVCQYANSSNGDFVIDRHPGLDNVWLVGAGSGHGFKHGPAVGVHVAGLVLGTATPIGRFALAGKTMRHGRKIQ